VDVASLAQAKAIGIIGSILVLLSPIIALTTLAPPLMFFADVILGIVFASGTVGLVGSVLILVAVKKISDAVNDREIFKNVLMAVIIPLVAIGIVVAVGLSIVMYAGPIIVDGNYLAEGGYPRTDVVLPPLPTFLDLPVITLMMLLGMWAALIVSAWFLKRGYERIAIRIGTRTFRTVGRLYFYGTLLAIVLVGLVLLFIAGVLQIKAFFTLPKSQPIPQVQVI